MERTEETTSEYILEIIAPIFNRKGYVGTSLSDLTKATNLTKGALYCNFSNKEELALESFKLNVRKGIAPLQATLKETRGCVNKLFAITDYYRNYYTLVNDLGGCPLLNVGVDAKHISPALFDAARNITEELVNGLTRIIERGIEKGEIHSDIDAKVYAKNIYSMVEGAVFMAINQENETYLHHIIDHIEELIRNKFVK